MATLPESTRRRGRERLSLFGSLLTLFVGAIAKFVLPSIGAPQWASIGEKISVVLLIVGAITTPYTIAGVLERMSYAASAALGRMQSDLSAYLTKPEAHPANGTAVAVALRDLSRGCGKRDCRWA